MKVALVTGAATGIGRACAVRLAADGFSIAANCRTRRADTDDLLRSLDPNNHIVVQGDLADSEVPPRIVAEITDTYGQLDLVVNAAGTFAEHDITAVDYSEWRTALTATLRTNLEGPMNLSYCAAQQMLRQRAGTIINITSRGAFRGEPDAPAYGASKAGLNSASQSLAKALAPHGISVFAIAPGWVDTPLAAPYLQGPGGDAIRAQSPLGRVGKPEEVARLVSFLAQGQLEYLTGAIIDLNGASYLRN